MKKLITLFVLISLFTVCKSQTISSFVIGSAGEEYDVNGTKMSFTVGEIMIESYTNGTKINQGFQSTVPIKIVDVVNEVENYQIKMYPNPSLEVVNIQILNSSKNSKNLSFKMYDINGKLMFSNKLTSDNYELNISSLAAGTYMLNIYDKKMKLVKSNQIIKM